VILELRQRVVEVVVDHDTAAIYSDQPSGARLRFDGDEHRDWHPGAGDGDPLAVLSTLDETGEGVLAAASSRLGLSARACHRVVKIARTIADLAGEERIALAHLREAIQYRTLDRGRAQSVRAPAVRVG